jgi:SulP family sulfate permease
VLVGVVLSGLFFAWKIGQLFQVRSTISQDGRHRTYVVIGQVFFASADAFVNAFDFHEALDTVTIDLTRAHFWDISAVSALDRVMLKFRRNGTETTLIGMNEASATVVDRLAMYNKSDALDVKPVQQAEGA